MIAKTYFIICMIAIIASIVILVVENKSENKGKSKPIQKPKQDPIQKPTQEPKQDPIQKPMQKPIQKPKQEKQAPNIDTPKTPVVVSDPVPTSQLVKENHRVSGTTYHLDGFRQLEKDNPSYDLSSKELLDSGMFNVRIYEKDYPYSKIELVPEPDNEHDHNAIAVVINNAKVGYIKSGSCSHVKKLISENKIKKINANIGNGKYKVVFDSGNVIKDKTPPFVHLEIWKEP